MMGKSTNTKGKACILGIDLGATSFRVARVGESGAEYFIAATPERRAAKELLTSSIREIVYGKTLLHLGLSRAPGLDENGRVSEWPSRSEWIGLPLLQWISEAIGHIPICSADDGVCAALWEYERHTAQIPNVITACLTIGTGLAIGLMSDGELLSSGDGAGTLSHESFGDLPFLCNCGKQGCLQTVLSVGGLQAIAEAGAMNLLDQAFTPFVQTLKTRYSVTRMMITGGGVSRFGEQFLNDALAKSCASAEVSLEISPTPNLSALGGALLLAAKDMRIHNPMWSNRIKEFIHKESNCLVEA